MEQDPDQKKEYELAFLVREESDNAGLMAALKDAGAEIGLEGPIRKTALAYEIKKETSACFGFVQFTMDPSGAKPLEAALNQKPEIMRFLLITPPTAKERPQSTTGPQRPEAKPYEPKAAPVLSNEALEKKIEEILK
jgi:ribosomal protein S6